ncbi:MAG: sigma-54-dependent Fis family transcriptional regulator [Candidatus Marinimicrobia bacterium]|nr:sigma-54-dependent Fis family transcriptional regulator [Candidatus Neomarinimicrobiota bacterium]
MAYIYVIDDDQTIREMLVDFLEGKGHEVNTFPSAEEAEQVLINEQPDIALLDVRLPGIDGLSFLAKLKEKTIRTGIIMMTGHADYHTAVRAIKLGARDFVSKPFSLADVYAIIEKALEDNKRNEQLTYYESVDKRRTSDMIGSSEAMRDTFKFIARVAASDKTSVLIEGETGTGKGMVARSIHYASPRRNSPFIEINCSAFQPTLLETELFGHEIGAFTGANTRKKGLLEIASGGSFFLDEVGDMSPELQSKLLKVLEDQSFRRVGGTTEIHIDTRIISATSKDLNKAVKAGHFRADLFYRLHVAAIGLPPLRERSLDILMIANHYLSIFSREFKKPINGLSDEVKDALLQHPWVGNVRELRNVIERATLFETGDTLSIESVGLLETNLAANPHAEGSKADLNSINIPPEGISFEAIERAFIIKAMEKSGGNKSKAAKLLGFSRATMKYRLKRIGVSDLDYPWNARS